MESNYVVTMHVEMSCPFVEVANQELWDLVEYLAMQRAAVTFTYGSAHFAVHFLRIDLAQAQSLINAWMESRDRQPLLEASHDRQFS